MNPKSMKRLLAAALITVSATAAYADYDLSWYTIDGGGEMFTTGGNYELSGTIGQPDAGDMAGGNYELAGGFWSVSLPDTCSPGDVNQDGVIDGDDIQPFVNCLLGGATPCECAETDGLPGLTTGDVNEFVTLLLNS